MVFPRHRDELNPEAGETQYIGSRKSPYLGRLYEKGWEQLSKIQAVFKGQLGSVDQILNTVTGDYVNPADWVRLELQARPKGEEARRLAAIATPEEA